jgi:uracil DNA glycosylase
MTEILISSPKLKWETFEKELGTWSLAIEPFFRAGGFESIYSRLKERSRQGKVITPISSLTFRAFKETPYTSCKVVLMGMAPYHSIVEGIQVADGLCMSCSNHSSYQAPSLLNFYDALEQEFEAGLCLPCDRPQSLSYLAKQGILLTNSQLTAEVGKPGIHEDLWRPFTQYMVEEVYSVLGVPLVFLGQAAGYFERFKAPMQWSFTLSHPASASYRGKKWDSEKVFSKVSKIISDNNTSGICWLIPAYKPPTNEI